jgi:hypothetical protein
MGGIGFDRTVPEPDTMKRIGCPARQKGQILILSAILMTFLFVPLAIFVVDTGLLQAGYAQLTETAQAAAEDGASMLNEDLYRTSHARSVELDPARARQTADQAFRVSRLPGLESWQVEVGGRTVTVTAKMSVRLFVLGKAALTTTRSAQLAYGP